MIKSWLEAALKTEKTQTALKALAQTNPFDIRLTAYGENPISAAIKISF